MNEKGCRVCCMQIGEMPNLNGGNKAKCFCETVTKGAGACVCHQAEFEKGARSAGPLRVQTEAV